MRLLRFIGFLFGLALLLGAAAGVVGLYVIWHYGRDLPNFDQLAHYNPPVTTRVYAGDGELMGQFAREQRLFVPVAAIPKRVIDAFISAEDKNFYTHPGIDPVGVVRAFLTDVANFGSHRRPVGASTITQQVAKNFLLSDEISLSRKIKEAILAFRIDRAFSKDKILELYLNEIYLGAGTYGVAAAALHYFDKPLDQLTIAEAAFLGALPKGPNNYNPVHFPARAKDRRDWVIDRMTDNGYITAAQAQAAKQTPLEVHLAGAQHTVQADWYTAEVRRDLAVRYGDQALYEGGLAVRTSLNPTLQQMAEKAFHDGLESYDRRHGWRGPLGHLDAGPGWAAALAKAPVPLGFQPAWRLALVLSLDAKGAHIGLSDGSEGDIALAQLRWARPTRRDQTLGPPVRKPADVLAAGDLIAVELLDAGPAHAFTLEQIPNVEGGMVVMDPHTGRVLALVGGWSHDLSQFDRAIQAQRQTGSAFKPIVYTAALDHGFTPSSLVLDAPIAINQGPGLPIWRPSNYERNFLGPATLRVGLEESRNLMTVRVAQAIGMNVVADYAQRLGVFDHLQQTLAMALGAGDTTLLRLTTAYAEFDNGGRKVVPSLIDRIQDREGRTIFRQDRRPCPGCQVAAWDNQPEPAIPDDRPQIISAATAYQITAMMEGVTQRGTARALKVLDRPLAGKTGTTNDFFDAWFIGFSPDLVAGTYVGFDEPRTLGRGETGARVAVPIFKEFIEKALAGRPAVPFRVPPGVLLVRVDPRTGLPPQPGDSNVILEPFKPGTEPTSSQRTVLGGDEIDEGGTGQGGTGQSGAGQDGAGQIGQAAGVAGGSQAAAPPAASPAGGTGGQY